MSMPAPAASVTVGGGAGGAGGDPALALALGGGGAAPAAAPGPPNLWSFLLPSKQQKAECKEAFCASPLGKFTNGMLQPVSLATGGLIGPFCPDPALSAKAGDLKKPADSALGAAARIKAEEAQVKARLEAVQYLGTVDCRYYPEAEAALIAALRADKSECVRAEAAKVLARGCCCTAKIVKALNACLSGNSKDGSPGERSELVLAYAYVALDRCLNSCMEAEPDEPPEKPAKEPVSPEKKKKEKDEIVRAAGEIDVDPTVVKAGYDEVIGEPQKAVIFKQARAMLAKGLKLNPETIRKMKSSPANWKDSLAPPTKPHAPPVETAEPELLPIVIIRPAKSVDSDSENSSSKDPPAP